MTSWASHFLSGLVVLVSISLILYGALCTQVYYYWKTYKDGLGLKTLILVVLLLETLHVAFCISLVNSYNLLDKSILSLVDTIFWEVGATIYLEVTISGLVLGFYVWRIWQFRQNKAVLFVMVSVLAARIGLGFRTTTYLYTNHSWLSIITNHSTHMAINAGWILNAIVDLMVTSVLVYYLYRDREVSKKRSTRYVAEKLIQYSLSTGVLTLMTSLALFITFNVDKQSLLFGGFLELITKLYANSMLAMLNARNSVAKAASSNGEYTVTLSALRSSSDRPSSPIRIRKETDTSSHTLDIQAADNYQQNTIADPSFEHGPQAV